MWSRSTDHLGGCVGGWKECLAGEDPLGGGEWGTGISQEGSRGWNSLGPQLGLAWGGRVGLPSPSLGPGFPSGTEVGGLVTRQACQRPLLLQLGVAEGQGLELRVQSATPLLAPG